MKPSERRSKPTITLRRHSTSPSGAGRAVIASISGSSGVGSIKMKTNPYVGWFRHSPPVAAVNATKKTKNHWCNPITVTVPTLLKDCKNSPHIGWFRHAPPSRLETLHRATRGCSTSSTRVPILLSSNTTQEEKDLLWKLLQELNHSSADGSSASSTAIVVSGYLKGGGRDYMERTRRGGSRRSLMHSSSTTAAEGTMMSTVNVLSQLASWFLFPVAHDAESCGYRQHDHRHHRYYGSSSKNNKKSKNKRKNKNSTGDNDDGVLGQLFSYYLPNFLDEPSLAISDKPHGKHGGSNAVGASTDDTGDDDSDSSHSGSTSSLEEDATTHQPSPKSKQGSRSTDLTLSVSSLAEAYYAHQTTTKELTERLQTQPPSMTATSLSTVGPVSPHRLDYVITQMDIARMTRNAARHLDVQSILGLPVITYRQGAGGVRGCAAVAATKPSRRATDQPGTWSWTIVEETEGGGSNEDIDNQGEGGAAAAPAQQQQQQKEDVCVICLEQFVDGDRLRVLPCDHSFHVGCIDRWLSGSQSFEECYTSGCPTCKKRPTLDGGSSNNNYTNKPRARSFCEAEATSTTNDNYEREGKHRSGSLDGSVPSWAFAQIGSALVAQQDQDQGISICSGVSSSS